MYFLIDADLPRSSKRVIEQHRHLATDVRDIGFRSADDAIIAAHAKINGFAILSGRLAIVSSSRIRLRPR